MNDEDKERKQEESENVQDGYIRIHQRYNDEDSKWEDFDPLEGAKSDEGTIFIVYHRHYAPNSRCPLETMVEIKSDNLRTVLKSSLRHIDSVFDPSPMV